MVFRFRLHVIWLIVVTCIVGSSVAQELLVLNGTVLSADDSLPVPGAHISIKGTGLGTAANSNGVFKLVFPAEYLNKTLAISSLGHKTLSFGITEKMTTIPIDIQLSRSSLILPKTVVEADELSAFHLVQKAISRIDSNCDPKRVMLTVFYREYLRVFARELNRIFKNPRKAKRKKKRVLDGSLAYDVKEGVFEICKYPYIGKLRKKNDLARLIKGRSIEFEPRTVQDSVVQSLVDRFTHKGGPHDMLKRDFLKDPESIDFMKENAYKRYNFKTLGITEYEGKGVFKLVFDQKEGIKDALFKGVIYIDTATYAFMLIDYQMSPRGIDYQSFGLPVGVLTYLAGVEIRITDFRGSLRYREYQGKWYPEYHQYGGAINVRMVRDGSRKSLNVDLVLKIHGDLLVNHIDKIHVREFKKEEQFKDSDKMEEYLGDYNDDFWARHNYVLPSEEMIREMRLEEKGGSSITDD